MQPPLPSRRDNDLPPRWDGCVVRWDPWALAPDHPIHICPPLPAWSCPYCGSDELPLVTRGRVAKSPLLLDEQVDYRDEVRSRLPAYVGPPSLATYRLRATRCMQCQLDEVVDAEGRVWLLDESDYGTHGSRPNS